MDFGTLLVPAALLLGAPVSLGHYEKGLFCDRSELVERVVERADRGLDPREAVAQINATLDREACLYTSQPNVRARTVKFEHNVAANHTVYSIYRVDVTAFGWEQTEIGTFAWNLPQPVTMYVLRAARPDQLYDH